MKDFEPSWQALQLLAMISEEHGLVRAARRVAMSQSAASHALSKLERTLGVAIVSRTAKGLKLSEAGVRLMPHVRQALRSLDAMREEIGSLAGVQTGVIRIAAVPSLAGSWVPKLIREFQTKHPSVDVTLFEGTDSEVAEWVDTGVAQAGFAALPVKGLLTEEIARDEWMAVLPASAQETRVTLANLAKRTFLLSGGGCEEHIATLFRDAGLDLPITRLLVKQIATIEAMVAESLGVSLAPSTALGYSNKKKIRAVPLSPRRFRSIGLLTKSRTPRLDAWTAVVRSHFGLLPQKQG